jgi:hypothetical protein
MLKQGVIVMSLQRKPTHFSKGGLRYYFCFNLETNNYEKISFIRGTEYKLSIKSDIWTPSTSKAVSRWIRSMNENRGIPMLFRWGNIQKINQTPKTKTSLKENGMILEDSFTTSLAKEKEENISFHTTSVEDNVVSSSEKSEDYSTDTSTSTSTSTSISSDIIQSGFSCVGCGRTYSSRSGLWKHEQMCNSLLISHKSFSSSSTTTRSNPRELGNVAGIQEASRGGIQIQNNNQNIQNINITLRDFGKENPDWLTENILYSILGNVSNAIPMMMQKKHFNDAFPENMNLRLNTKNDMNHRLQVWEGGKWRIRDSKETFYKVVIEIYDILSDALSDRDDEEEEDTSIHPEIRKARKSKRFIEKVEKIKPLWEDFREKIETQADGDDNEVLKDLWEDLKTFLLDRKLCLEQEK